MGMGAGCRTLGETPARAGSPIRQHAPVIIAPSAPPWVWCALFVRQRREYDNNDAIMRLARCAFQEFR
eukprot:3200968-Pyramimonas_sp.AAC.1